MKRLFFAAALMAFLLCAYVAAAATITGVDVLEYGLYTYDEKVVLVEERHGSTKLSNIRKLQSTYEIPYRENTFFSIKYVLNSPDANEQVDVELRVTSPTGGVSKGALKLYTGVPTVTNIEFSDKDAPGAYLFQIVQDETVLLSKEITLLRN